MPLLGMCRRIVSDDPVMFPAATYFPGELPLEYRRRWDVSLPCSGWERVVPSRSSHRKHPRIIAHKPDTLKTEQDEFDSSKTSLVASARENMYASPRPLVPLS